MQSRRSTAPPLPASQFYAHPSYHRPPIPRQHPSVFLDRIQTGVDSRGNSASSNSSSQGGNDTDDSKSSNTGSQGHRAPVKTNNNNNNNNGSPAPSNKLPAVGDQITGSCLFVEYDKDKTPLEKVVNVAKFPHQFVIERVKDGVRVTFKMNGEALFRHWSAYPIHYYSNSVENRAKYLANNTITGMSKQQVTLVVNFESRKDGEGFERLYKFGLSLGNSML